jgi:uncharacterized protein (DUF433 family)
MVLDWRPYQNSLYLAREKSILSLAADVRPSRVWRHFHAVAYRGPPLNPRVVWPPTYGLLDRIFSVGYFPGMDYRERITIEPDKRGGKPCIRGMRITVYDVLGYLASGMSEAEILTDFPYLQPEDIRASLAFAADLERRLMAVPGL